MIFARLICWRVGHVEREREYTRLGDFRIKILETYCARCGITMGYRGEHQREVEYRAEFQKDR